MLKKSEVQKKKRNILRETRTRRWSLKMYETLAHETEIGIKQQFDENMLIKKHYVLGLSMLNC